MAKNILIIDDEVNFTKLLENYFRSKFEYKVFNACDGKAVLGLIQQQSPALVLLDMKLPTVNGLEILKILREQYPECRVIVMTAYDVDYKKEMDAIGYDAFFLKPIPFHELKEKVIELLAQKTSKPASKKISIGLTSKEIPQDRTNCIPTARIAIIEPRDPTALMLKGYLENTISDCKFTVLTLRFGQPAYFNEIEKFNPDIVLYDTITIGHFSDFATKLMNLPNPAKEIILFGDPESKWDEVEELVKSGMRYISMPLNPVSKILPASFENLAPARETVERLLNAIKDVRFKYGLINK